MTTKSKTAANGSASPSLAGWQARALHRIQLPSGQWVRIRLPGIATLLEHGDLPDDLVDLALKEITQRDGAAGAVAERVGAADGDREVALQAVREFGRFQKHLACAAVVEVGDATGDTWQPASLDLDALDGFPEDDLAMVAEIVQRIRFTDARGVRVGVEPLDRWAMFRQAHGCADEDCEGCTKLVRLFSTADLDVV